MKKSDLILPRVSAPISVGQTVVFVDGSYTYSILKDEYVMKKDSVGLSDKIYTVVGVNLTLPTSLCNTDTLGYGNNCIVKSDDGDIIFCSGINIVNTREIGLENPQFTFKHQNF